jgi:AraC-like DNA-binding protein
MTGHVEEHSLPAVHALHLAELIQRWRVTPEELLGPLGLSELALSDPEARISMSEVVQLVERARALTAEPGIGFLFGMQMRISAHGYLGFAAMSARNVREALELATRFAPTRTTAIGLRLHVDGDLASVVIEEQADLGSARDVVIFALLVGIWQIGNAVTGRELTGTAEVALPRPGYYDRFAPFFPVRFDQPAHQLLFPSKVLDMPLTMADAVASRLAREQCQRALDALALGGNISRRVRVLMSKKDGGFRSLEEVAGELGLSPRTLKRRLAEERTAFSDLLEEERRERALLLLRSGDLSIERVAERVGYSDVANFNRAFRRWTGKTPAAYRRSPLSLLPPRPCSREHRAS